MSSADEPAKPEALPSKLSNLKVMVVDDDPLCLKVIEKMLKHCNYQVSTFQSSTEALQTLRERHDQFDIVLSDVYMPDMDGFKLLELIGLELGVPVIMMSSNGETNVVFRGVVHGAVDFLIKPVRVEELRNLWQHVVRKSLGGTPTEKQPSENDEEDSKRSERKRKESQRGEMSKDVEEGSNTKKPRVVWSVEMHQQFVNAVNQLGVDKAVPKRILDLMNVEGLTRENVASHLQKYRLYLKRVAGISTGHSRGGRGHSDGCAPDMVSGSIGSMSMGPPSMGMMLPPQAMMGMPGMNGEMFPLMPGMPSGMPPFPMVPGMPPPIMPGMLPGMPQGMPPGMPQGMPPGYPMPAPLLPSQMAAMSSGAGHTSGMAAQHGMPNCSGAMPNAGSQSGSFAEMMRQSSQSSPSDTSVPGSSAFAAHAAHAQAFVAAMDMQAAHGQPGMPNGSAASLGPYAMMAGLAPGTGSGPNGLPQGQPGGPATSGPAAMPPDSMPMDLPSDLTALCEQMGMNGNIDLVAEVKGDPSDELLSFLLKDGGLID